MASGAPQARNSRLLVCEPPVVHVTPPPPPPMAMAIATRPQDWAEPARSILFTEAERARAQVRR